MHALIIEDEYLIAHLIEDQLGELGYKSFSFATDEDGAVAQALIHHPDLITSDVQILKGCGIDAVHRICARTSVPVLYITGVPHTVRERCPWAAVIQKPYGMADLSAGVREARGGLRNAY